MCQGEGVGSRGYNLRFCQEDWNSLWGAETAHTLH